MSKQSNTNKTLVKCLIDIILFMEFSEDIIDEDSAIEVMEKIAYELSLMDEEERKEISSLIVEFADDYSSKEKEFIQSLPDALGLV